jgi:hypothetical protein
MLPACGIGLLEKSNLLVIGQSLLHVRPRFWQRSLLDCEWHFLLGADRSDGQAHQLPIHHLPGLHNAVRPNAGLNRVSAMTKACFPVSLPPPVYLKICTPQ